MRIIGFHFNPPNIIQDSTGRTLEIKGLLACLDFLNEPFERPGERDCFKVCFDLDAFCAPIFRLLSEEQAKALSANNEITLIWPLKEGNIVYIIKYRPKTYLILECKGEDFQSVFYNLQQYCPDSLSPKSAEDVAAFGRLVVDTCKNIGFYPRNLFSAVSILSDYAKHLDLPQPEDIPEEANLYALRCCDKPWREAFSLGFFPHSYQFDLRAAYSSIHRELLHYKYGTFTKKQGFDPTATYGYCRCTAHIPPRTHLHPLVYRNPKADEDSGFLLGCYTGTFDDYYTMDYVNFVHKWKRGVIDVHDGWYFHPKPICPKPLKEFIERLQRNKAEGNQITRLIAKNALNGLWGYTLQTKKYGVGELFNPPWAAMITPSVNLKVCDFLLRHKTMPLHVITDGCGTDVEIPLTPQDKAQGWELDFKGELLIISTGLFHYGTKHPASLTLSEIKKLVSDDPKASCYEKRKRKVVTLGDAIRFRDMSALGTVHDYITSIDLNGIEHSRYFKRVPKNGEELMTKTFSSIPYDVNQINEIQPE
jgi:hypothetical protein